MNDFDTLIQQVEATGVLTKTEAPYSEGPLNAKIVFVGEAPGAEEEIYQRPFVGPAGQLLNEFLQQAGIIRDLCRFENVLQFRPYRNDISPYIKFGTKNVKESQEFKEARAALIERLNKTDANVIVPLGNVPLYALTGLTAITKRRGSILYSDTVHKKVISTIHPSAALRQYVYRYFIIHDLKRIKEESLFPEAEILDRTFFLEPSFTAVMEYLDQCMSLDMIGFDIEIMSEEVSHVGVAMSPTNVMCIPLYEGGKDYFTADQEAAVWRKLDHLLSNPNVIKVGQNLTFDSTFVNTKYGICVRPIEDTMVASGILFPNYPKGLDFLVSIYCNGEPYYKDEGKKWWKNPFLDNLTFRRYNAMDAAVVLEIFPQQVEELKRMNNYETYLHQVALIEPLAFITAKGIRMNAEGLKKASFNSEVRIAELQKELNGIVGFEINHNSPKQMQEYFYERKHIMPYRRNILVDGVRTSVITCDENALKRIAGKGYKEAQIVLEMRHLSKMKGTYYDIVLDKDNRLRCSYTPITKQGRLSSGKTIFGTGGNLQNQPEEMKRMMIADEGHILVNVDLSQAENRIVAYVALVPRMMKAFENGKDIHSLTASLLFNKPANEISDEKGSTDIGGGKYSERDLGKRSNHGFNYGLGPDKFAVMNELAIAEGRAIYAKYHAIYPEVRQWHASIQEQLNRSRVLVNSYGRRRLFVERWGEALFGGAYNFIPQSNVADKINREGLCYIYYNQDKFYYVILLNQVHDSIIFEFPLSAGPRALAEVLQLICKSLETPVSWKGRTFVIPADIGIGFNLGKRNEENKDGLKKFTSAELYQTDEFIRRASLHVSG